MNTERSLRLQQPKHLCWDPSCLPPLPGHYWAIKKKQTLAVSIEMTIKSCRRIQRHYPGNELAGEPTTSASECTHSVRNRHNAHSTQRQSPNLFLPLIILEPNTDRFLSILAHILFTSGWKKTFSQDVLNTRISRTLKRQVRTLKKVHDPVAIFDSRSPCPLVTSNGSYSIIVCFLSCVCYYTEKIDLWSNPEHLDLLLLLLLFF